LGVPCAGCGREYDVALFAFGRTIRCTCGSRVGREVRRRALRPGDAPAFLADAMLGRLARWLRLLGVDCAWEPHVADETLVRRAVEQGRVILTRDRRLPEEWRVSDVHVLRADDPFAQLREVLHRFDLAPSLRLFSRCSACNVPLGRVSPEEVAERVPERIAAEQSDLRACPACGRVYWEGSHTERIRRVAERLLEPG